MKTSASLLWLIWLGASSAGAFTPLPSNNAATKATNASSSSTSSSNSSLQMFPNPLQQGKFALVRSLAGDYDEQAVRARLNGLIQDQPVLMLSFTT
mmetsp:Transcript_26168/g.72184  ORF Transcript_26168/g.72184 Transcript_26168/m.72184 type:complete len:96 (-) Transcript_26168:591-878(-)